MIVGRVDGDRHRRAPRSDRVRYGQRHMGVSYGGRDSGNGTG